ncbi:UPF0481 protein [Senna tora]|uniref:UPF0481 protein n=1 Tax=Senna tora TaxID=362788 RepID=A0A834WPX2_9FABA|nr:UPF0481 protein [Senna tora]
METRGRANDERNYRSNHVGTDVELVNSLKHKLERLPLLSSECCIYRAPKHLFETAQKSFIPKIISIGPFHHKREDLQKMEKHKLRYLKEFLQRSEASLEDCIKLVQKSELRLRKCYAEAIELNHVRFVEMILVDAAFVIEVLVSISFPELRNCDDWILGRSRMLSEIRQDMFLMENQLPFFIMEDLLTLAKVNFPPHNDSRAILIRLTLNFFKRALRSDIEYYIEKLHNSRIEHLLDLARSLALPRELPVQRKLKTLSIPNVTQLYHSGVKFRVIKHGNLFGMRFQEGILEFPSLYLSTRTETLMRNLNAFERCHFKDTYMNNLFFLIDRLIDSPSDVEILIHNQILETDVPDSEGVASIINNLATGAPLLDENFCFADICDELNAYCRVPWHKWKATLKREYLSTPWAAISLTAVTVLLFLTFLQTLFTIYSSTYSFYMEMRGRANDETNRGNHICKDIEKSLEIANSLRQKLEMLPLLSSECCIYRAPKHLREKAQKSFIPKIVSIGPFHHNREDLQDMEKHKLRYLKEFLQRSEVSLEDCIKLVHKSELRLRNCYAEAIELNHVRFVEMILVDAAFIIEVLMRISFPELGNHHDRILGRSRMLSYIIQDMLLLENQLPFFIIEDLFTLSLAKVSFPPHNDARVILIELLHKFLKTVLIRDRRYNVEKVYSSRIEHLLDFVRSSLLPPELPIQGKLKTLSIPNVTRLYHSGVKFRVAEHSSYIRFHRGILEIPIVYLCSSSETLIRNIIAYERCHFNDAYMNNLLFLIDRLIDSPSDVEILIHNQILETDLPDSQGAATFINNISPGGTIPGDKFYLADVCDDLNAYCRVPWHKWKATLKREYFSTPWSAISVIAVTVLLFLTFLQTVFTVYSSSCR